MRPTPFGALFMVGAFASACGGDPDTKKDTSTTADSTVGETDASDASDTSDPDVVEPSGLTLPASARGCEILLREASVISDVEFAVGVRGTFIREAPLVAISVVNGSDVDFADGAIEVLGSGSPPATIVVARCVDSAGAPVAGEVTFQ